MKLLGVDWYTTKDGAIGIVFYKDDVGKLKGRIGHTTGWGNEGADIEYILSWGAKFPTNAALELFGYSRITYNEGGIMDEKEIVKILKDEGLDIAEEMAVQAVKGAIKLIKEMLPKVNPMVNMLISPLLDQLLPILLGLIDKIDGEDDPGY